MAQPTIPGYSIVDRLGSGGFATVFLATDDETGNNVAIKVLHDHTNNPSDLRRFEREQTTMHALNGHPNIVGILDSGTTDDERHYSVLEFVGGGSVRDRITSGGALHWANVVEIGVQICAALDIAHRSGVLHRDVKPANILLEENLAKLGDFGIARLIGQSQVTAAQSIIGTLAYTPPEVFHNKPFDGRGDIYQLGVSLYEMLLGRAPFTSAAADNKATIIRRILDHPAPPLAQFDVPQPLSDLLNEVLAKDPADRPQTAESFGRRLNQVEVALGRTPTSVGATTQPIIANTQTLRGDTSAEHGNIWPQESAENDVRYTVVASTPAPSLLPPQSPPSEETPIDQAPAAQPAVPEQPVAPTVDPPFDANVTIAEPLADRSTSLLPRSSGPAMSLGTPGPAPAHFDNPATPPVTRSAAVTPPSPRRWPWILLAIALVGAAGAGVFVAQMANNSDSPDGSTTVDAVEEPDSDELTPSDARSFEPLNDPAFLLPEATNGVIFDVVANSSGLTMVGGAGQGESAATQGPVVWTIDNEGNARMQRDFESDGRFWSVGVNSRDFLVVGDTAEGAGETDGIASIGGKAADLEPTTDDTFTGPAKDGLRASVFDPSSSTAGFLVGGSRTTSGVATAGLWQVERSSNGAEPAWRAIPISGGNPGVISDISATESVAVAVGSEQVDGSNVGVIYVRRSDGNWSKLIEPLANAIFHSVAIAGERIIAVGEIGQPGDRVPMAVVSRAEGDSPLLHMLPIREQTGVARDVAQVLNGRVVVVGDTENPNDASGRIGAIWELLPQDDFAGDLWTTVASADLPVDQFTELRAVGELNNTVYVFGRTEVDDRRPAGAWTLTLNSER